jgi:hypothetical protein
MGAGAMGAGAMMVSSGVSFLDAPLLLDLDFDFGFGSVDDDDDDVDNSSGVRLFCSWTFLLMLPCLLL